MAIEFFTGFEGCGSNNDVRSLFDVINSTVNYSAIGGHGGSKGITVAYVSAFDAAYARANYKAPAKTKACGMHYLNPNTSTTTSNLRYIFQFYGPSIRIFNDPNGLKIMRDSTIIYQDGNAAPAITADSHIEAKLFSDAVNGSITVKVNGVTVIDETGLNTGGQDIIGITLAGSDTTTTRFDNIYLSDDLEGELISVLRVPEADDAVQFTPSAGADNYAMVDEAAQDGDSTYVESDTVADEDIYAFEDISSDYVVKAVTLVTVARKDDAGLRALQAVAVEGAVPYAVGDEIVLTEAYPGAANGSVTTLDRTPGDLEWTHQRFNDMKFGFKVSQ